DLKHRIECELQQSGLKFACEMEPVTEKEFATLIKPARPQEPKPPFPYEIQEVEYTSTDGTRLAGSLTLPQTSGPHPVVILISGSGPQDRDETIMGHKPFFVIADYLTRHGIAVLRTDDRGVGKS